MSKKQLRRELADKEAEIEKIKASLNVAVGAAENSQYRLNEAIRSDQLAAGGPLKARAERDRQSVADLKALLDKVSEEAERIRRELMS